MKAVVLAAGEGKRMHPLTYTRPKAMVYAAGKPLLWHILNEVKKAGINEAVVVVRYKKEKVIEYFEKNDVGLKLEYVEQGENYGTAAAVLAAKGKTGKKFLVIAGDIVTDAEAIKKVMEAHKSGITLGAIKVENPSSYGVLKVKNNKVVSIEEKPQKPKGNLINTSIYMMDESVFAKLDAITPSIRGEYEITDAIINANCIEIKEFWMDIAYPWNLFDAQDELFKRMNSNIGKVENSTVKGKIIMEEGAEVFDSYIDEGTHYIGAGSRIGPHTYLRGNNSIGSGCEIGESTTIKNSIIFDNVKAKHLSYIGDSIIGENVNFGSGTQIANFRFDEKHVNVLTERGWVNTGRKKMGTVVGDNTKFGVLSCVVPGKTIGDGCWIGSGISVDENMESGKKIYLQKRK
ncbi:NTP transferase domain-containing protein [Candidatus Micrarchaeota archaeon]|nr:NTP transferase domain-containing protein [Candidatus Micrarchaeota archaeon]